MIFSASSVAIISSLADASLIMSLKSHIGVRNWSEISPSAPAPKGARSPSLRRERWFKAEGTLSITADLVSYVFAVKAAIAVFLMKPRPKPPSPMGS